MKGRLGARLVLLMICCALAPVIAFGAVALLLVSRSLQSDADARAAKIASDTLGKVETYVQDRAGLLSLEGSRGDWGRMARGGQTDALQYALDGLMARYPEFDAFAVYSSAGAVLATPSKGRDGAAFPTARLPAIPSRENWFRACLARRGGDGYVVDWGRYPLSALSHRQSAASLAHRNPDGYSVLLAAPFRDGSGGVSGVFCGALNWTYVQDLLDDVESWYRVQGGKYGSAYAWMTLGDADTIIGHPSFHDPWRFGRSYYGLRCGADLGHPGNSRLVTASNGVVSHVGIEKRSRVDAYARSALLPSLGASAWVVWVGNDRSEIYRPVRQTLLWLIGVLVAILLLTTVVGVVVVQRLTGPLGQISDSMISISEGRGDLTQRLPVVAGNEVGALGRAFNASLDFLNNVLLRVRHVGAKVAGQSSELSSSSEQLALSSHEIAKNVQEVAGGLSRQATRAQELSQLVADMVLGVRRVADLASETAVLAARAIETATHGGDSVTQAVMTMKAVNDASLAAAAAFRNFERRSEQIGQVIQTISAIADQTNLLALNAAIEAARAGERGKGFAVVADEVRKLAESAGAAVREVADVIRDVQDNLATALRTTANSAADISQGSAIVNEAGSSLETVIATSKSVSEQMESISRATAELVERMTSAARAVDEIANVSADASSSTEQMAAAVEEQTASIEQLSATAGELARVAGELRNLLAQLRLREEAGKTAA